MAYGYLRAVSGTQTHRKEKQTDTLSQTVEVAGVDRRGVAVKKRMPVAELPPYEVLLRISPPGIL